MAPASFRRALAGDLRTTDCYLPIFKKRRVPCSIGRKSVLFMYGLLCSFPGFQAQMRDAGASESCCS